ncbi:MAG: hypothetical protein HUJ31_05985 [Pseudomonadales bacterium]|nr:hypothetical protein [Pseudomonadales bacterium]
MSKTVYTQDELEAEHQYAKPHIECGLNLHGGFDAQGNYLSPRTRYRWDAVNAWHDQLKGRGVEIVEATTELLVEPNYPNTAQQLLLLQKGIDQSFWNSLTITGLIEGRGRALADVTAPDFQAIIEEDIDETALGHMNKGLLRAHGWDEGGNPATGLGGHDVMWFAVRDLVFGKDKYPVPEPPASIGREKAEREMEQIPVEHEGLLSFLMNLLMIEVRAERAFSFYETVIGNPDVFTDKRDEAANAILLINRIRQDEGIHVAWLKAAISEFRSFTIKTVSGERVNGAEIVDPVWEKMVRWHAVEMHDANREVNRNQMKKAILEAPNGGPTVFDEFEKLAA